MRSTSLAQRLKALQGLSLPQLQLTLLELEREKRRRRQSRTAQAEAEAAEPLMDFIPRVSPRYMRPSHLRRLTDVLERTDREPIRAIVNLPPRHSKTETLLHFVARKLKRRPWDTVAYVTYVDRLANEKSVLAREYAARSGVTLRPDAAAAHRWLTDHLGGAIFTSIGGSITGQGANVLIVDDPHKDRAEAESPLHRQRVWDWYAGTATDRVEVGGSIIVCQTRWHPDDLTGRLLKEQGAKADGGLWDVISLPALGRDLPDGTREATDDGDALWPERWTREELLTKKINEYEWRSKFQQSPIKKGGAVFKDVRYYNPAQVPGGLRISIGIDLAYSEKTHAHWSAIVVLGEAGGIVYVLYVQREQLEVPAFAEIIRGQAMLYPGAYVRWHTSTTEAGTAQLLKSLGIPVRNELARADKFIRAQPCAAAWNAARVLVPGGLDDSGNRIESPGWVSPFVSEVTNFTGLGDTEDDQVDALGSAYSPWAKAPTGRRDIDDTGYSFG